MTDYHRPVLAQEVADFLVRDASATYLDATFGGGGHTRVLLDRLAEGGAVVALDRDPEAVERGRTLFADEIRSGRLRLRQTPFSRLSDHCAPGSLAGALFDLGVSSRQLDARERGFTFEPGAALDMRMGPDAERTALEWLRETGEEELAAAFRRNSDLERSRALAKRVKELLRETPEAGSDLLRQTTQEVYRPREGERAGLLARVFQAIRMEVNREAGEIREVKAVFGALERDCVCPPGLPVCVCGGNRRVLRRVVRRPLVASPDEIAENPRARSAKLRVMEKL